MTPDPAWGQISISLSPRLSPRNLLVRRFVHLFVGSMQFAAVCLPDEPAAAADNWVVPDVSPEVEAGGDAEGAWYPTLAVLTGNTSRERGLRLWGLTLGMTMCATLLSSPPLPPKRRGLTLPHLLRLPPCSDLIGLMQLPPIDEPETAFKSALPYTVPSSFGDDPPYAVGSKRGEKSRGGKDVGRSGLNAGLECVAGCPRVPTSSARC